MKYIRADLLWNKIAESAFFSAAEKGKIRAAIENEPGENVKPVVHAHWVACEDEYEDEYKCSACGGIQFFAIAQEEGWKYCPYCGARMDEEEGNDTGTER
jgi:DNA-directed RNA polymerase subunit RPC12/RpoP